MNKNTWDAINNLYHKALEIDYSLRTGFLKAECGEDKVLFQQVTSLLNHSDSTKKFDRIVGQTAANFLEDDMVGKEIGPYRIINLIGRGGMGDVFLAERSDHEYEKLVAIKIVCGDFSHATLLQRFHVERQILANLQHPYIAKIIDGGSTDHGTPYLVMDYIEGNPIDQYCKQKNLSIGSRLKLFVKVCEAVQHAHQNLIVHRDLKPSNLLVTENGTPCLLDFGIAKVLEPQNKLEIMETRYEDRMLTPSFCSPEQIAGTPISTATDVYSLGTLLYLLLTERLPFHFEGQNAYSVEHQILNQDPLLPSLIVKQKQTTTDVENEKIAGDKTTFDLGFAANLSRRLKGDLDRIVMKAIRKEAPHRYSSVADLADDIKNYLNHRPVKAHEYSWRYLIGKFIRRNRLATVFSLVFVFFSLSFGWTLYEKNQTIRAERDLAQQQSQRATIVLNFFTNMLSEAKLSRSRGKDVLVRDIVKATSSQLMNEDNSSLSRQPLAEASIRNLLGGLNSDFGQLNEAKVLLERSLEIQNSFSAPDIELRIGTLINLSYVHGNLFKHEVSHKFNLEALELAKKYYGEDHIETANLTHNIGVHYHMTGRLEEAEKLFLQTYQVRRTLLGDLHVQTINSLNSLGTLYYWLGNYSEAERFSQECFDKGKVALGVDHPSVLFCLENIGSLLETTGQYQKAKQIISRHLELATPVLGEKHPNILRSMHNLADTYRGLNLLQESELLFQKTLALRKSVLGDAHVETLQTQMKLGRLYREWGKLSQAEPLIANTLLKQTVNLGETHQTTLRAGQEMADLILAQKRYQEAEHFYTKLIADTQTALGGSHPDLIPRLFGIAQTYYHLQKYQAAEESLLNIFKIAEISQLSNYSNKKQILELLLLIYQESNQAEKGAQIANQLISTET